MHRPHRRHFLRSAIGGSVAGILLGKWLTEAAIAKEGEEEKRAEKKPPIKIAQIGTGHAHAS